MNAKTVLIIAGPTASGKSDLAIELALHFNTAIISADSRQCFHELSIGTAKPDEAQLNAVTHYFINSHSVADDFGAGQFASQAGQLLPRLFESSDVVVVCGGTGLYLKALTEGLDDLPPVSPSIRLELKERYENEGLNWLQEFVRQRDPLYYQSSDSSNPARLLRAAELIQQTGQPYSSLTGKKSDRLPYRIAAFVPDRPRASLYQRIETRVEAMMAAGLLEEVRRVQQWRHTNALQTVGYRELFDYLDGKCTLQEAIEKIKQHTRNYAKRQLTWFRNQGDYRFIPAEQAFDLILKEIVI